MKLFWQKAEVQKFEHAKDFAEEYGGSIHVKSTLGEGTEFTISFPTYDSNGSKNF